MNIDSKNPQQYIDKLDPAIYTKVMHHYQVGFTPGMQGWSNI